MRSRQFEAALDRHETSWKTRLSEHDLNNHWDDSTFDREIRKSFSCCGVKEQQKSASVEHELRVASPPFEGPRCDSEASRFSDMSIDSDGEQSESLKSRTRSALPRTGSMITTELFDVLTISQDTT
jgi:hypothetical protein